MEYIHSIGYPIGMNMLDINKYMWVCDIKAHCRCGLCVHKMITLIK